MTGMLLSMVHPGMTGMLSPGAMARPGMIAMLPTTVPHPSVTTMVHPGMTGMLPTGTVARPDMIGMLPIATVSHRGMAGRVPATMFVWRGSRRWLEGCVLSRLSMYRGHGLVRRHGLILGKSPFPVRRADGCRATPVVGVLGGVVQCLPGVIQLDGYVGAPADVDSRAGMRDLGPQQVDRRRQVRSYIPRHEQYVGVGR
jgi:hypothetical protein